MVNEPVQLAPLLAIYEDEGEVTVRVGSGEVAKSLSTTLISQLGGHGFRRLTFITPTDTKVFKLGGQGNGISSQRRSETGAGDTGAQAPDREEGTGAQAVRVVSDPLRGQSSPRPNVPRPPRERIAQDPAAPPAPELAGEDMAEYYRQVAEEEELRAQERVLKSDPAPDAQPLPEETEPPKRVTRQTRSAQANAVCGRCRGGGVNESGGTCPVCKGSGQVQSWGRARARGRG